MKLSCLIAFTVPELFSKRLTAGLMVDTITRFKSHDTEKSKKPRRQKMPLERETKTPFLHVVLQSVVICVAPESQRT